MEFLSLVALVALAAVGVAALTAAGYGETSAAQAMLDIVKIGFGAIVALAYAARGGTAPTTTTSTNISRKVETPQPNE